MEPLLKIEHLSVHFPTYAGQVQAVRDVSFFLEPGETLAIWGESGSGQFVTARGNLGLKKQTNGVSSPERGNYNERRNILTYFRKETEG